MRLHNVGPGQHRDPTWSDQPGGNADGFAPSGKYPDRDEQWDDARVLSTARPKESKGYSIEHIKEPRSFFEQAEIKVNDPSCSCLCCQCSYCGHVAIYDGKETH